MPDAKVISVKCQCGHNFQLQSIATGQEVRCPQCNQPIAMESNLPDAASNERKPCPFCGESIAMSAIKCRFCGEFLDVDRRPAIKPREASDVDSRPVQIIEQTAKQWKAVQAISALAIMICFFGFLFSMCANSTFGIALFVFIGLLALVAYMVGSMCAWWFHG